MNLGPTVRHIPMQEYKVCHGCVHLDSQGAVYGHNFVKKNYVCKHPDFKDEHPLLSNKTGRQIHYFHEGDCTTPDWCPFLKSKP